MSRFVITYSNTYRISLHCIYILLTCVVTGFGAKLEFSKSTLDIVTGHTSIIELTLSEPLIHGATLQFTYDHPDLVKNIPNVNITPGRTKVGSFNITSVKPGHVIIGVNSTSTELHDLDDVYVRVDIVHDQALVVLSTVIGWIYFAAWSISFYPQCYENYRRKSVIGLNFDFISLNITGFLAYGLFNIGMYWIPQVEKEYLEKNPRGINPVQLNDVVFTLHAIAITVFTIFQCCIYDRGRQKISRVCVILLAVAWTFALVALFVSVAKVISWFTYLLYLSYIKLGVTLIKYIPQRTFTPGIINWAPFYHSWLSRGTLLGITISIWISLEPAEQVSAWMNFQRKSTEGWSIGNVLLDFTGGSLSILQMFLLSYNNDDWNSIFGDPTKFGLGFFSMLFDILFMVQHYCLYRNNQPYSKIEAEIVT